MPVLQGVKLSKTQNTTMTENRKRMKVIPYASAIGSIKYAMLSVFWERGSPDLPACGPWRGSASGPVRPIFINKAFKTLVRGQASRGGRHKTSSGAASPGTLVRSKEIKARGTSQGSHDTSHDDHG